jgi:D-alanyl-D-alanine carboxypeptidase/D-alanyl-D-alanine-endopeptidase (penicillin-binding protein 4)
VKPRVVALLSLLALAAPGCVDSRPPNAPAGSITVIGTVSAPPGSATASADASESRGPKPRRPDALRVRPAPWGDALDAAIGDAPMSVSIAIGGRLRFSHLGDARRPPASNEKLLLSMALLDRFGPRARISTTAEIEGRIRNGTVRGDVWIVGHGDPEVDDDAIDRLASALADADVDRITGSVVGDTSAFDRGRWAPGWHRIALSYVSIPTALTFDANADANGFVFDPERRAAAAMTDDLEADGVDVGGAPGAGRVPDDARTIGRIRSAPLVEILRRQNTSSINLDAEVLTKRLGAVELGRATTRAGGRAIERWAREHGARVAAHDGSGLSYANRVGTDDLVRLLCEAERESWGDALRSTLPSAGAGTLAGRLAGLDVRAKTGTLIEGDSALSGWVRTRSGAWAAFSILSTGMSKDAAVALEDEVVRFVAEHA